MDPVAAGSHRVVISDRHGAVGGHSGDDGDVSEAASSVEVPPSNVSSSRRADFGETGVARVWAEAPIGRVPGQGRKAKLAPRESQQPCDEVRAVAVAKSARRQISTTLHHE